MRVIRLVPFVLFFLLLGGQVLVSEKAYAICCGCTWCRTMLGCSCPGQDGCAWYPCRTTDAEVFQTYTPIDTGTVPMTVARNVDVIDRLVELRQVGECARRSIALRLLGDAARNLKADPAGFDSGNQYSTTIALQIGANAER